MKLLRLSPGRYTTPDLRYLVEKHDDYETDCECMFCLQGRNEFCPNNRVSVYSRWVIWDRIIDDYAKVGNDSPGPSGFDTMNDARDWLNHHHLGEESDTRT